MFGAKASCAAALRSAKAVVKEAGSAVSPALNALASRSERHAESVFHRLASEQGLALDIPLTELTLDSNTVVPVLLLSDWIKKLLTPDLFLENVRFF